MIDSLRLATGFLALLFTAILCASEPPVINRPFLYRIESPAADGFPGGCSYLFGTLHFLPIKSVPVRVREALPFAKWFAAEHDARPFDGLDEFAMAAKFALGRLRYGPEDDEPAVKILSTAGWNRIRSTWGELSEENELLLKSLNPHELRLLLNGRETRTAAPPHRSMDAGLITIAGQFGVPIHYLESVEEGFAAGVAAAKTHKIPRREVLRALESYDPASIRKHTQEGLALMTTLYLTGEETEISEIGIAGIETRNANWTEKITELLRTQGNGIIAVGARHVAGKESLPDLLRRKGLQVTRVAY